MCSSDLSALRQSESGAPYVYRLEGTVLGQAEVQLGIIDENAGIVQVLGGLSEGDRIIVGNVGTVGRGMRVQVVGSGPS